MNIVELRDRLNQIIESNEKQGWVERNKSDMVVSFKTSKRIVEYRQLKYASGAWMGFNNGDYKTFELITEDKPFSRNGNRRVK